MRLKTTMIMLLAALAALVLLGCSQSAPASAEPTDTPSDAAVQEDTAADQVVDETEMLSLTLEELAQYNGQDGMPAYVAIDGDIYDMSAIAPWAGGKHNGHIAGTDLTEDLKTRSPHGVRVLKILPKVGKIKE